MIVCNKSFVLGVFKLSQSKFTFLTSFDNFLLQNCPLYIFLNVASTFYRSNVKKLKTSWTLNVLCMCIKVWRILICFQELYVVIFKRFSSCMLKPCLLPNTALLRRIANRVNWHVDSQKQSANIPIFRGRLLTWFCFTFARPDSTLKNYRTAVFFAWTVTLWRLNLFPAP